MRTRTFRTGSRLLIRDEPSLTLVAGSFHKMPRWTQTGHSHRAHSSNQEDSCWSGLQVRYQHGLHPNLGPCIGSSWSFACRGRCQTRPLRSRWLLQKSRSHQCGSTRRVIGHSTPFVCQELAAPFREESVRARCCPTHKLQAFQQWRVPRTCGQHWAGGYRFRSCLPPSSRGCVIWSGARGCAGACWLSCHDSAGDSYPRRRELCRV